MHDGEPNRAKQYLLQVRKRETAIQNLCMDRENLRELMYSIGGVKEGDRVQSSKDFDRFGSIYAKINEKEEIIADELSSLIDLKLKVSEEINSLQNWRYVRILHSRYLLYKSFEEIAVDMNYSYRYVTKMHGYALNEFDRRILSKKSS